MVVATMTVARGIDWRIPLRCMVRLRSQLLHPVRCRRRRDSFVNCARGKQETVSPGRSGADRITAMVRDQFDLRGGPYKYQPDELVIALEHLGLVAAELDRL